MFILFISLCSCYSFYVKLMYFDIYVGRHDGMVPNLVDRSRASIFYTEGVPGSSDEVIIRSKEDQRVFDIEGNVTRLIIYPFHGQINQRFKLTMDFTGGFRIINQGRCLEYDRVRQEIHSQPCKSVPTQLFELVGAESRFPFGPYHFNNLPMFPSEFSHMNSPSLFAPPILPPYSQNLSPLGEFYSHHMPKPEFGGMCNRGYL